MNRRRVLLTLRRVGVQCAFKAKKRKKMSQGSPSSVRTGCPPACPQPSQRLREGPSPPQLPAARKEVPPGSCRAPGLLPAGRCRQSPSVPSIANADEGHSWKRNWPGRASRGRCRRGRGRVTSITELSRQFHELGVGQGWQDGTGRDAGTPETHREEGNDKPAETQTRCKASAAGCIASPKCMRPSSNPGASECDCIWRSGL